MPIQSLQLKQDPRDPNKRWLEVTRTYDPATGATGYPEQFTLSPQQFSQLQNAGLSATPEFNNPLNYNQGPLNDATLQRYANEPVIQYGTAVGQTNDRGFADRQLQSQKILQSYTSTPTTGGTDLATDTAEQQRLVGGAWGGANNPFSSGALALPGMTGTEEQQKNLQTAIANPNMAQTGNDIPRYRDESGAMVQGTQPITPPTNLPSSPAQPTSSQPNIPAAPSFSQGKEVAPFGMESLQRGPGQGATQQQMSPSYNAGAIAPVQPTITPPQNTNIPSTGAINTSAMQQQGLTMKAPPEPQFKNVAQTPQTSTIQQASPRSFPGLSAQQVQKLDSAYTRGMTGAKDKANIDYATKRFGYTPPSAQGQKGVVPTSPLGTQQQAFVPPNQDQGVARNLKAEQDYVKTWQGKEGRLPTANEINMAVYGKTNPQFNLPAPVSQPTGQTQVPTAPPASMMTTPSGGQSQAGITPPSDYLSVLEGQVKTLNQPSQDKISAQKQLDDLLTSKAMGLNKISDQPIAMPFITGQGASVERIARQQADTLERQLARFQAELEGKRQAAFDVAQIEEKKAEKQFEQQKFAYQQQQDKQKFDYAVSQDTRDFGANKINQLAEQGAIEFMSDGEIKQLAAATGYDASTLLGMKKAQAARSAAIASGNATKIAQADRDYNLSVDKYLFDVQKLSGTSVAGTASTYTDAKGNAPKLTGTQADTISGFDNTLSDLDRAFQMFDAKTFQTGPLAAQMLNASKFTGIGLNTDQVQFEALLANVKANFMKAMSGAAVSDSEVKRLSAFLPSIGDQEDVLQT